MLAKFPDDTDILDLSMELNAASIDDIVGGGVGIGGIGGVDLDEHGIERVPMADPGLDVSRRVY